MPYFITIQYPYQYLTVTLSDNKTIISSQTISKFQAISGLLPALQNMLTTHNLTLADIACIGVNIGPGPFNTLRSIIATANAIAFATKIPLVGCNGLELLLQEHHDKNVVVILDAFGNDVYFAIIATNESGYDAIENVLQKVKVLDQENIIFIGNGAVKHQNMIKNIVGDQVAINHESLFASTQSLIDATCQNFAQNKIEQEIFPLYFASPVVKN
jgi:tRNA threonylcarbamoyl adenosine modification protein YeaZ